MMRTSRNMRVKAFRVFCICAIILIGYIFIRNLVSVKSTASENRKGTLHEAEQLNVAYSVSGEHKAEIVFVNHSGVARNVYWLDYTGKRVLYNKLPSGQTYALIFEKGGYTYLTHPWLITDEYDNALAIYYPDTKKRTVILE